MFFTVTVSRSNPKSGATEIREQDLLPGGSERLVTEQNKSRYVQLLVEW